MTLKAGTVGVKCAHTSLDSDPLASEANPQMSPDPGWAWNGVCLPIIMQTGRKMAFFSVCIKLEL